ncbi:MAG: hypothetical protein L3J50_07665 [Emcibacter sp.]|nr:hypothetical protein [Emcibacter sp.]
MSNNKFTAKQQEMLHKAQRIIDRASLSYGDILNQHILSLKTSLDSDNIQEAIRICHLINSQAGTFGWPLAGELSGWFKRVLMKQQQESGLNSNVSLLFMDSLDRMVKQDLRAESKAAVTLLRDLEAALKDEDIR